MIAEVEKDGNLMKSDRFRQEYLVAESGFDTAENEPFDVLITDILDCTSDDMPSVL